MLGLQFSLAVSRNLPGIENPPKGKTIKLFSVAPLPKGERSLGVVHFGEAFVLVSATLPSFGRGGEGGQFCSFSLFFGMFMWAGGLGGPVRVKSYRLCETVCAALSLCSSESMAKFVCSNCAMSIQWESEQAPIGLAQRLPASSLWGVACRIPDSCLCLRLHFSFTGWGKTPSCICDVDLNAQTPRVVLGGGLSVPSSSRFSSQPFPKPLRCCSPKTGLCVMLGRAGTLEIRFSRGHNAVME